MKYLFVVAHPDDEVLGAGATISKLSSEGHGLAICCMNSLDRTRYKNEPGKLLEDYNRSLDIIGIPKTNRYIYNIEDGDFCNENHRHIVELIENAIKDFQPDYIFTHYYGDMNDDHKIVYQCCKEAARYSHRGIYSSNELKGLYMMEVLSETNWGFDNRFEPKYYIEVDTVDVSKKIEALKVYENVIRAKPHPRSETSIMSHAYCRGAESNCLMAESFMILYEKR